MGKGSSSSETSQSTSTSDNRVGADNGAVVLQDSAQQNISFSPEVADLAKGIVNSITDFSKGVVSTAGTVVHDALASQEKATNAVLDFGKSSLAASPSTSAAASAGILSNQSLATLQGPLLLVGAAIILFIIIKKK